MLFVFDLLVNVICITCFDVFLPVVGRLAAAVVLAMTTTAAVVVLSVVGRCVVPLVAAGDLSVPDVTVSTSLMLAVDSER